MIDNPEKTALLMDRIKKSLPIMANVTPYLARELEKQSPGIVIPARCNITDVLYTGDMGGILCRLDIDSAEAKNAHLVSITHLAFNRNAPCAREIEAYQRHRIKKLKQEQGRE